MNSAIKMILILTDQKIHLNYNHNKDFTIIKLKRKKLISKKVNIGKIFSTKTLYFKLTKTWIKLAKNKINNKETKMQATYSLIEIFNIH
jgi:hypothetical protein